MTLPPQWAQLAEEVNGRPGVLGAPGVRDPDFPCEVFDGLGYDGTGRCHSDGHWVCLECSQLSPDAPRFHHVGRYGNERADRLRAYWTTLRFRASPSYARRLRESLARHVESQS